MVNGDGAHTEEGELKQDGNSEADGGEDSSEQEVIVIQDTGFTIKIQAPGTEPFDLQEMVQEIHQVLMDREDTCHRTCFSLQLDGNVLDNFAELKSIEGLQEGSLLKVVEEPYTVREARIHVRHIRDLLKSLDPSDAYNGVDCNSLSFLSIFTDGDLGGMCLKVLTMSGWNPPPGNRKMHGDLMYLYIVTVEERHVSVTASTRGFYLNQSTTYTFNPKPANPSFLSHSLVELLSQISPAFKKNFTSLQKKRCTAGQHRRSIMLWTVSELRMPTPPALVMRSTYRDRWVQLDPAVDGIVRSFHSVNVCFCALRREIGTRSCRPPGSCLGRTCLSDYCGREPSSRCCGVHSDFAAAATRGAMAVIDGNVMAINPGEETRMQMFIWNNIFFSLGFDVRDHYRELGGDAAAHAAPTNDLNGVRAYGAVDVEGLYTLGTVVVDYRGYRVTAQSIIPGILEREQEQSVIYGSIDFGKTVVSHDKYLELLDKTSRPLKVRN
ncbi:hypothetical protein GOODEAATRI_002817 [Goodea atripinnis]|uniref:Clu domain-containing protein n=1 Tax=Goodea atripinnis TaxID=208336 RepID=A0ABV0MYC5_9TELE